MANTMAVSRVEQGSKQFQGAFSEMWLCTGTVTDQDAIADDVSVVLSLTVPGVSLGDMVLGLSFGASLADANASIIAKAFVSAANTVILQLVNVDETTDAYDADTLNGGGFKMLIGRPSW
jgi:hypothetical protein